MPNKLPSPNDILGTNKLPSPDEILKKKGASQLELKERYSSLDTFINQEGQPLESLRGGDLYTYGGIRYIKLQNKWYRDYDGNFVRLSSGNVAQRERELNTNAKRFVDPAEMVPSVAEGEEANKLKYRNGERLGFYLPDVKPTTKPVLADRDWSKVNKDVSSVIEGKYKASLKDSNDEVAQMMKDDFESKEWEAYNKIEDIGLDVILDTEENSVTELNKRFKGSGIYFEETGLRDQIKVISSADNKFSSVNEEVFNLYPSLGIDYSDGGKKQATDPNAKAEQERLKEFIRNSLLRKSEKEYLNSKDLTYENMIKLKIGDPKKYGEQFIEEKELSAWLDKSSLDIASSVKWLKNTKKDVYKRIKELEGKEVPYEVSQELIYDMDRLSNEGNRIINKQNETSVIQEGARVATGYYYSINEEKGDLGGVIGRGLVKGLTNMAKMDADLGAEILPFIFGEDATSSLQRSKMVDAGMSDTEINNALTRDLKEKVNDKAMESLQNILSFGTTKEYVQSENRNDIEKVASFLSESIGTVASAGGNPTLAKLAFFAQSYNAIEDQMKSSEFDELNVFEKKLLSVPYGLVIGYLERLGFKVSTGGSSLLNGVVTSSIARAFTQIPKEASIELMKAAINKSVAATMAEAGLSIVGGAIVEGAVEGTQNITEVGAKQLFNSIEGKDYFKGVPDLTTKDGMAKALEMASEDFYYGMLGGLVMGSGSQAVSAVRDGYSNNKLDANFDVLYNSVTDPNLRRMVKSEIKANLASGAITKEQAKEQMDAIEKSYSIFTSMPDKLSTRERREAFNLIREKQIIQKEIEGKDPSLVDTQKKRVSEIDEQLKQISNNAIKETTNQQQAVTAEGGVSEYQGTSEGQQEVGVSEGGQREATVNETDRSDSTIPSQVQEEVATYRAEEQAELLKAIPKIESYKVNGEVDKTLMPKTVLDKYNKIYNKYDKLISPLLETAAPQRVVQEEVANKTTDENYDISQEVNNNIAKENPDASVLLTPKGNDLSLTAVYVGKEKRGKGIGTKVLETVKSEADRTGKKIILDATNELDSETDLERLSIFYEKNGFKKVGENKFEYNPQETTAKTETKKTEYKQNLVTPENAREVASRQDTPLKQKIAKTAAMIMRALPGVKIYFHNNEAEMHQALADSTGKSLDDVSKQIGDSRGSHVDGEIHINMENAKETTILHEAFHEAILRSGKSIKTIIDFANSLKNIISDKDVKAKLDKFVAMYGMEADDREEAIELENKKRIADGGVAMNEKESDNYIASLEEPTKSDEFLAELGAIMAEAETELTTTKLQKFLNLINRIARSLGLPVIIKSSATAQEAVDFINSMARSLRTGEEIEAGEYVDNPASVIKEEKQFGSDKTKITVKYTEEDKIDQLIKDELVKNIGNIKDLGEIYGATTSPDDMLVGAIYINNEIKAEGFGGIYFVTKFGDVWASSNKTTADQIVKRINQSVKDNKGKGYLFLTKGSDSKLISSPQGASSSLKIVESMVQDGLISASDFRSAINQSMKDNPATKSKINLSGNMSSSDMIKAVDSLFDDVKKSSFDNRGTILKSIIINIGNTESAKNNNDKIKEFLRVDKNNNLGWGKSSKTTKTTNSVLDLIANISREDVTRGLKNGDVYAVIEIDGEVEVKEDNHKSYPFHIKVKNGSKPKLILFKNREHGRDVLTSSDNKTYSDLGKSFDGVVLGTASNGYGYGKVLSNKKIRQQKAIKSEPVVGNKLFNEPLKEAGDIAESYMKSIGKEYVPVEKITKLDEGLSKRISDAYDQMKNDPADPKVKAAYEAMAKETLDQYDAILSKGYKVELNNNDLYSSSEDMIKDLRDNRKMNVFPTESGFGDEAITDKQRKENVLLRDSGKKDANGKVLLVNDVFRFVHDFFGHAKLGNSFGPIGEENAWRVHSEMYSPEAKKAMTSETRGQNSFVNFSGVNDAVFKKRDKARELRKEGKIDQANQMVGEVYEEMKFADQKVGLLPSFAVEEGSPSKIKLQKNNTLKEKGISDESIKTIESNYEKQFGFYDLDWNKESDRKDFENWFNNFTNNQFDKNISKVINLIKDDIDLLNKRQIINEKLKAFEELIIPALGEDVLTKQLSVYEQMVIMDSGATIESIQKGFEEAKNILDKEGNLDKLKITDSPLFKGGEINLPAFERFVEKNPESKGVFNDWKKILDESNDLSLKQTNAFRYPSLKSLNKLYDELNDIKDNSKKIKLQKTPQETRMDKESEDVFKKSLDRGTTWPKATQNALDYIQKSKWYQDATDVEREQKVRDFKESKNQKLKKAPSVAKVLGKPKPNMVTVNEAAAFKDQLRLEAKAAREAKADLNSKRKSLSDAIKGMVKLGKLKVSQASTIIKRVSQVNLDNPVMVDRLIDYAAKVFERADYQERLDNAFSYRRAIKKLLKSDNQAQVVGMANEFAKIDPSMVENIDDYIAMAEIVKNAVAPSKVKGLDVVLKESANIEAVSNFSKDALEKQEQQLKAELLAINNDLLQSGVISGNMTIKEIQEILNAIKDPTYKMDSQEKERYIRSYLSKRFESLASIVTEIINTNQNPLTGEKVAITVKDRAIISDLLDVDMSEMSIRDAIFAVEAMDNFVNNGITSKLEGALSAYKGQLGLKQEIKSGKVARALKLYFSKKIGRYFATEFTPLPLMMERMFSGVKSGISVMRSMGLDLVINGVNKANYLHNKIINEYYEKFIKNSKTFHNPENIYERGMLSFLKRNVTGSLEEMKAETSRRIKMIQESIATLMNDGDESQKAMAEIYQKVFDKLDVSSGDIDVIDSRASKENKNAVDWWVSEWSKHYQDLHDVSLSVYNYDLGSDVNYTPDRYKTIKTESFDQALTERNSSFLINMDHMTDKSQTGVLMQANRPKVMPDGRYISLDFDANNSNSLKGALVDINTAAGIRQVDGFLNSKLLSKLIPVSEDRSVLIQRTNRYIRRAKGKIFIPTDLYKDVDAVLNFAASLGVGKALGGVLQSVKQTIPIAISTAINTGKFNMSNFEFNEWLNKAGMPISNRGIESLSTIESMDRRMEAKGTKVRDSLKWIQEKQQLYVKWFLSKPDVFIARSGFQSYYLQYMGESSIDWANHEPNQDALNYAQAMVDRQQNISDPMLGGEFLTAEDGMKRMAKKILFPFASFGLNQKARLYSDIINIGSKTTSTEDRKIATKSAAATIAEMLAYRAISVGIGYGFYKAAAAIISGFIGDDDDDDKENSLKWLLSATKFPVKSMISDLVSPIQMTDRYVTMSTDFLLSLTTGDTDAELDELVKQENEIRSLKDQDPMTERQEEKFRQESKNKSLYQVGSKYDDNAGLGMISIASDLYKKIYDDYTLATTGEFQDDYKGNVTIKRIRPIEQDLMKNTLYFSTLFAMGILPKESDQMVTKVVSMIKKNAMSESEYEKYEDFKKEFKREPSPFEIGLIKSDKKYDYISKDIDWVNRGGGLNLSQGREYVKLLNIMGEVNGSALLEIKAGKTADQISKSMRAKL